MLRRNDRHYSLPKVKSQGEEGEARARANSWGPLGTSCLPGSYKETEIDTGARVCVDCLQKSGHNPSHLCAYIVPSIKK